MLDRLISIDIYAWIDVNCELGLVESVSLTVGAWWSNAARYLVLTDPPALTLLYTLHAIYILTHFIFEVSFSPIALT